MKKIFDNYEAFYNMILCTTLLSNSQNGEYLLDAKKIIEFIGNSYSIDNDIIDEMTDIILNKLSYLGLNSDKEAVKQNRYYENKYDFNDMLNEIKCNALDEIEGIYNKFTSYPKDNIFDYSFYHIYNPKVRYFELSTAGKLGIIPVIRLLGVLNALGIGCEKSIDVAVLRFTQCIYWGDIPSMYFLLNIYRDKMINSDLYTNKYNILKDVIELSEKYLRVGITVLPKHENCTKQAKEEYIYISSILQDIIINLNKPEIIFSFVEAIMIEDLSYEQRLGLINNFKDEKWKVLTNSIDNIYTKKVGF